MRLPLLLVLLLGLLAGPASAVPLPDSTRPNASATTPAGTVSPPEEAAENSANSLVSDPTQGALRRLPSTPLFWAELTVALVVLAGGTWWLGRPRGHGWLQRYYKPTSGRRSRPE